MTIQEELYFGQKKEKKKDKKKHKHHHSEKAHGGKKPKSSKLIQLSSDLVMEQRSGQLARQKNRLKSR